MALQARDDRPPVLRARVALHEPAELHPARRVVVHRDQHEVGRPPRLQPRVDRAVPLHQLAQRRTPRPPTPVLRPLAPALPHSRRHQPPSDRLGAHAHAEAPPCVLRQQRRSETGLQRVRRQSQHPLPHLRRQRPVRPPAPQSVDRSAVALRLEPAHQTPKVAPRHPQPRRPRRRRQHPLVHLPQHRHSVPLPYAQLHSLLSRIVFGLRPNMSRKRTFLLWQDRTFLLWRDTVGEGGHGGTAQRESGQLARPRGEDEERD